MIEWYWAIGVLMIGFGAGFITAGIFIGVRDWREE